METIKLPGNLEMDWKSIIFLKSSSNYTEIFSSTYKNPMTVALSLCHVTKIFNKKYFLRINRSTVINSTFIKSIERDNTFLIITLWDGKTLKSSRRRTETVLNTWEEILQKGLTS